METTQEISPLSIISLFDTTKAQRQSFVDSAIDQLRTGWHNPLDVHLQIKCMEEILEALKSRPEYKQLLMEAAEKYGTKQFEYKKAKISIKEAGGKWDFSATNDTKLFDLEQSQKATADAIKQRQEFLKTIPEGGTADPETGEIIYRAAKPISSTILAVTLK